MLAMQPDLLDNHRVTIESDNMVISDSISLLEVQLNQHDPRAAEVIFQRYVESLIRLATPRMLGAIRQKIDPEDLVQSAMGSFFRRHAEAPFTLNSWDNLGALLATITLRKCRYHTRHFSTAKRQLHLEEHLEETKVTGNCTSATEPTPLESAEFADLVTQLLDSLSPKSRQICELALLGHSSAEIAERTNLTERTVFRQMERIRTKCRELEQASC